MFAADAGSRRMELQTTRQAAEGRPVAVKTGETSASAKETVRNSPTQAAAAMAAVAYTLVPSSSRCGNKNQYQLHIVFRMPSIE